MKSIQFLSILIYSVFFLNHPAAVCAANMPQEVPIENFNRSINLMESSFTSIEAEKVLISKINAGFSIYFESGGEYEHSLRTLKSTVLSSRIDKIKDSPLFALDMMHYHFVDSLVKEMIHMSEHENRSRAILNAAIHFRNSANRCVEQMMREGESENRFKPNVSTKMAYLCFQKSDIYIELYERMSGEKSPIEKSEWGPELD
jgi:hypothetical protein